MTIDAELETWRREWRDRAEPLPELKKKIKRQNLQTIAAGIVLAACLVFSTVEALRSHSSFMSGFAIGLWFATVFAGGYAWWVRRGAWRPSAQTTLAYVELSHQRAVAKVRTLRFSFYLLLATTLLFAVFGAWNWKAFAARDAVILAALALELIFFAYYGRRKKREVAETRKLLEQIREDQTKEDPISKVADVKSTER